MMNKITVRVVEIRSRGSAILCLKGHSRSKNKFCSLLSLLFSGLQTSWLVILTRKNYLFLFMINGNYMTSIVLSSFCTQTMSDTFFFLANYLKTSRGEIISNKHNGIVLADFDAVPKAHILSAFTRTFVIQNNYLTSKVDLDIMIYDKLVRRSREAIHIITTFLWCPILI